MYQIFLLLVGTSLFLLGLSVGGVVEYRRISKRAEKREEVYLYNLEQTAQMIFRIENKLDNLSRRSEDRWQVTKQVHLALIKPEKTQSIRPQNSTPPMPWRFCDDPDATDPGYET